MHLIFIAYCTCRSLWRWSSTSSGWVRLHTSTTIIFCNNHTLYSLISCSRITGYSLWVSSMLNTNVYLCVQYAAYFIPNSTWHYDNLWWRTWCTWYLSHIVHAAHCDVDHPHHQDEYERLTSCPVYILNTSHQTVFVRSDHLLVEAWRILKG